MENRGMCEGNPGYVRVFCDVEIWEDGFFSYGWRSHIAEESERIGLFIDEDLPYGWKVFMHGTPAMVRKFLLPYPERVELITGGESRRTALMLAACFNLDPEVVEVILERGADVNARDFAGMSPLMHAAGLNPNGRVIAALIRAGAEVNASDHNGMTPLMFAADHAQEFSCVQHLIDEGADVNARTEDGWSSLMFAARHCSDPSVISALLEAGANARFTIPDEGNILDLGRKNRNLAWEQLVELEEAFNAQGNSFKK